MSATATQPLNAATPAPPVRITYRIGDRVSALVELPDGTRRLLGDVTASDIRLFKVRWVGGYGVATYAHAHEPNHLRHATTDDDRDALTAVTRHSIAADYVRMADQHPRWPAEVLRTLRHRAAQLTGDTR